MTPHIRMRLANKGKGEFQAKDGTIWLYDAIASDEDEAEWFGGISPRQFVAALAQIDGPVTLRINSPGGSVFGAQAMIAAMRQHPHPITARIDSLAASAASVIASECAECIMVPGSMMMIHKAWGMAVGNADDMRETADLLEKIDAQIAATYQRRKGEAMDFAAMMKAETWFDAAEAVEIGLADRIDEANTQRPKAQWDLTAYQAAPWVPPMEDVAPGQDAPEPKDLTAERARRLAARLVANQI